ncbi:MAG TPA: M1 family aminopeptidase, partial [Casimicrobiaceae bacterium]|nr:M1 family aminopeptidase [Casimicrobiaceae bacterium]
LRLPSDARPTHYALSLAIVPGAASAQGEIAIDVALDVAHRILWLNAVELAISRVTVDGAPRLAHLLTGGDQFVGLAFDPPLPAGEHRIALAFEAKQNRDSARGIFTLDDNGASYTMTQFESTSARRAFPCFDEPGFKVPWEITLRIPRNLSAISNTPIVSETPSADRMKVVRFGQTTPLPSYLIAFAVGPWDIVNAGRVGESRKPVRVIAGQRHRRDLAFAIRTLPELLAREEEWFGIGYPYAKLDHAAIPLTVRFAMENAGLITYGAPILIAPGSASAAYRHTLVNVAAHEIAHQWFGDLVTMAWWDDIWLNEAFATWFADKTVDAWNPAYEHGAGGVRARANAIEADSLSSARSIRQPIATRGDIYNAFDSITYQKGATVIGMFEGWLGQETFRRGVRAYLEQHRDGNASADDFLRALAASTPLPVAPAFRTFLDQNGVPEVAMKLDCAAARPRLELIQRRYAPYGATPSAQTWNIPVCVRYGSENETREACTLLVDREATMDLGNACPTFVFANAGGRGYYVASYDASMRPMLATQEARLTPAEHATFVYDLRPGLRAGEMDAASVLDAIRAAATSPDRAVLAAALDLATFVRDEAIGEGAREDFAAFVRETFGPRARAIGFTPRHGESDDDRLVRRALLRFAGADVRSLAREARSLAQRWLRDRAAVDPGIADTVLLVAAESGDRSLFDAMERSLRETRDRLDRRNLMIALFSFRDPMLASRAYALLLDPHIDVREAMTALGLAAYASPPPRPRYDFIAGHFDALAARVDGDAPGGWPGYAEGLCSEADRTAVASFWRDRAARYPGATRNLAQVLESIDGCARLRAREAQNANAYLARFR